VQSIKVLFDFDGVLARFTDGAFAVHGIAPEPVTEWNFHHKHGLTDEQFYAPMGRDFWAGLGRWEDGFALLGAVIEAVGRERVAFLTSPCRTPGCDEGKRLWAATHLSPLGFDPWRDVFIGSNKAFLAHWGVVLVEDSDATISRWRDAGGHAWLVPRLWNGQWHYCDADGTFDPMIEARALLRELKDGAP